MQVELFVLPHEDVNQKLYARDATHGQTAQLFQTTRSAIEAYQDDKKDQAGHLPQRSPEEIVSGTFSDRDEDGL